MHPSTANLFLFHNLPLCLCVFVVNLSYLHFRSRMDILPFAVLARTVG